MHMQVCDPAMPETFRWYPRRNRQNKMQQSKMQMYIYTYTCMQIYISTYTYRCAIQQCQRHLDGIQGGLPAYLFAPSSENTMNTDADELESKKV